VTVLPVLQLGCPCLGYVVAGRDNQYLCKAKCRSGYLLGYLIHAAFINRLQDLQTICIRVGGQEADGLVTFRLTRSVLLRGRKS